MEIDLSITNKLVNFLYHFFINHSEPFGMGGYC